jgi:tetratricopeptide (TPR) repeat protein/predicted aspartyl protease
MNLTENIAAYRRCAGLLILLSASLVSLPSFAACKRAAFDLQVTMLDARALIPAKINGEEVHFVVDSGAWFSIISAATAAQFKLKVGPAPFGLTIRGIGGSAYPSVATVKTLTLANVDIPNREFLVGGSEVGRGSGSVGILGQNFLEVWDVEYDLANGTIRLMKDHDCEKVMLAYWVAPDQPVSMIRIDAATPREPFTIATAYVNGVRIRVLFDTGAATSVMSLKAAARAGVMPDSPGVVDGGYIHGIGGGAVKSYIAPFESFKFADAEEVKHTRLRIADSDLEIADMLIGADFFLSHRIFVANSQRRLYFTYNGGPVFNLSTSNSTKAAPNSVGDSAEPKPQAAATQAVATEAAATEAARADAAAFARRGTAFAARRQYDPAIAELTRAVELDSTNSEFFFERGVVYWRKGQSDAALTDFNRSLELKPGYVPALMDRAELRVNAKNFSEARSDLDAIDGTAAKEADVRFELAHAYERVDALPSAIAQFDLWIPLHGDDSRIVDALHGRCRAKALLGIDLDGALKDCNKALDRSMKNTGAGILDSRALVRLRRGEFDKSIADYDAALKLNPQQARSLYGRGIAKLRKQRNAEGEVDIAAAEKIAPKIAENFSRRGIDP